MKVLIIDDNKGDKVLIEEMLKEAGADFEILWAASGIKGIELAIEHAPEIILLDTLMPGLDGLEICQKLKSIPNLKSQIIVMTGSLDGVNESRAYTFGADEYCIKHPESLLPSFLNCVQRVAMAKTQKETKFKILVVEDNLGDQRLFKDAVDELIFSCQVFFAKSAKEAMDCIKSHNFNFIFMDIELPGLSGGDFVKQLSQNPATYKISIIFLTGACQEGSGEKINVGGKKYPALGKPIEVQQLKKILKDLY